MPAAAFATAAGKLLWLLKVLADANDWIHDSDLAIIFKVSERTIERDFARLVRLGAPVERRPNWGYRTTKEVKLPLSRQVKK